MLHAVGGVAFGVNLLEKFSRLRRRIVERVRQIDAGAVFLRVFVMKAETLQKFVNPQMA